MRTAAASTARQRLCGARRSEVFISAAVDMTIRVSEGRVTDLPKRAQVVIVGGGIVGCSVAYHLTLRGCTDVLLLERKQLTCGTTWHAAGLVGQLRATRNLTRLAQYTTDLYATLETVTGQATGFRQIGSLAVA
jgi:glutamyl-tRNA reductase